MIPWDKSCVYGHADGMLRFVSNDKVLISGFYENANQSLKRRLLKALENTKIDWEWLRFSDNEVEINIAYINFVQTKDFILIPALNQPEDNLAFDALAQHFADYVNRDRILQIDVREIFKYDGTLNCISWTILE